METEAKEEEGIITGNLGFDLCDVKKEKRNKGGVNCDTA
jgi:hypothetical protein